MSISPQALTREMSAVDQIRQLLGENPDPKLLLDTIAGETSALEIVDALIEIVLADEKLAEMAKHRATRLETRAAQARATLLTIVDEKIRQKKLQRPLATLSVSRSTPQPRVTEAATIPSEYMRTVVDLPKLGKALRDGERIDGAELSNTRPVLVLRPT